MIKQDDATRYEEARGDGANRLLRALVGPTEHAHFDPVDGLYIHEDHEEDDPPSLPSFCMVCGAEGHTLNECTGHVVLTGEV